MIELMILFVLLKRDLTMYSIQKRIREYFLPFTNPSFGAIKPALVRLEKNKFIIGTFHSIFIQRNHNMQKREAPEIE